MLRTVITTLMATLVLTAANAQRAFFSQGLLNPGYNYTALSGYHGATQVNAQYRNLWPGTVFTNKDYHVGVDVFAEEIGSGVGLSVLHSRVGSFGISEVEARIAPRIKIADHIYILTGLSATYTNYKIDPELFGTSSNIADWANVGAGLGVTTGNFIFLLQSHYLTQSKPIRYFNNLGDPRTERTYGVYLSHRMFLSENVSLAPVVRYDRQGNFNNVLLAINTRIWNFSIGSGIRWGDAVIFQLGYDIANRVLISYSYDLTVSSLSTQNLGSHELGIRTTLFKGKAKKVVYEDLPLM